MVSVSDALNVRHSESARFIDHVAIAVTDADAASRWYVERLGMRVLHDDAVTAAGVRLMYLAGAAADGPQTMLQLVQPFAPGAVDTFLREHGEGLHHVCFAVEVIGVTLAAAGDPGLGEFTGGRGRLACFLAATPNSVNVELTEVKPSSVPLPWSEHAGRAAS